MRAVQVIVGLIVFGPPLKVMLAGRNLYGESYYSIAEEGALPFPVLTLVTAGVGVLSLLIIALNLRDQSFSGLPARVMGAFLFFFLTNVLLCVPFAEQAYINRSHLYPVVLFLALYLSRDDGSDHLVDAAKTSLMIMMTVSLIGMFVMPETTRRVYAPEVRLPFIDFRFWGFGEHANAIAPMALLQLLLTLYRPYRRRFWQRLSYVSGGLVLLLAQSQTAWFTASIVLPLFYLYRTAGLNVGDTLQRARNSPYVVLPAVVFVVVAGLGVAAMNLLDQSDVGAIQTDGDLLLTGRPDVWNVAWQTFLDNPIFGYGLLAWEQEFRENIRIGWAVHAHNQLLQSLSVAGAAGAIGLIVYVVVLFKATRERAAATRGLAPAILFLIAIRSLTEVPLDLSAIPIGDTVGHMLLFRLLTAPSPEPMPTRARQVERQRRRAALRARLQEQSAALRMRLEDKSR